MALLKQILQTVYQADNFTNGKELTLLKYISLTSKQPEDANNHLLHQQPCLQLDQHVESVQLSFSKFFQMQF